MAPPLSDRLKPLVALVLPPLAGFALLLLIWSLVAMGNSSGLPTPLDTWKQALTVFSDPFYSNGPNDQGVGWNVLSSLRRVALGFGLAALVGIPLGFIIGRFEFLSRMRERNSKRPMMNPRGIPTSAARPKPSATRRSELSTFQPTP